MTIAILAHRGFIRISGIDARAFLQGLVTCNMDNITPQAAGFGALLSPQGKILFDFFIYAEADGFILDCPASLAADLLKRLTMYKLRAKLTLEDLSGQFHIQAVWDAPSEGLYDPRSPALGRRLLHNGPAPVSDDSAYHSHRIQLGIAEGGLDYVYGDTFPHEANFDRVHGVDFQKGCYVGQEVVSRMQHKTQVRKRVVPVYFEGPALPLGADIVAGDLNIGRMGSSIAGQGLALLRLDRAQEAQTLTCNGYNIRLDQGARALFEKLILDGFQAGLSWITILRKRDNFRSAFDGFAPDIIAHYTDEKCASLMQDTGIVRNRAKIAASVISARAYLDIEAKHGFSNYLWNFVDGRPLQNNLRSMAEMKAETPLSLKISKELRTKGFNFVGPTIVYAFMQAVGMANDHLVDCFRHAECAELGQKL
eukprot:gene9630-9707_t